ncbi:MAG: hypothetical protein ABS80_23950 [Pseudonocardia sp. SCN 72-51]|nr:MAG: hypothetical protein ABS80_23950 [Pseudonocardia sp. SCN 72-51]
MTGHNDPGPVMTWLAEHGHPVTGEAARSALRRRPAAVRPRPVATNGHPVIPGHADRDSTDSLT